MIQRVPFDQIPAPLVAELEAAGLDAGAVYDAIELAIDEDLPGAYAEDVTSTATIPADAVGRGVFAAREEGVVAGLVIAEMVFRYVMGETVTVAHRLPDGSAVRPGDVLLDVAGPTRGLLTAERTALNYATHLSGVATATAQWVKALEGTGAKVLDTRKTLPTYRTLQKYAVRCGGGHNHRFSLADMALVKDNHIVAAGGAAAAYRAVRELYPVLPVEVEVDDLDQLRELLDAGCERILLDNMSPELLREAVAIARAAAGDRVVLEASGGLTLEKARAVAETGVDWISVGAITHSVRVFDIGLDLTSSSTSSLASTSGE